MKPETPWSEIDAMTAKARHDLKAGDLVYIKREHWFKRFILWIAFWKKPVVYTVKEVTTDSFTYEPG